MRKVKLNLRTSAHLVIKEVEVFWEKGRIPVRKFQRSIDKLESLYSEWRNLNKSSKRTSLNHENKEKDFIGKFNELFDISHANAMEMMTIEEDKLFLICQRDKERKGCMASSDYNLYLQEKHELTQKILKEQRDLKLQKSQFMSNEVAILDSSTSSISSNEEANMSCDVSESNFNDENEPGPSCSKRKRGKRQFITSKLVAAFDKCKILVSWLLTELLFTVVVNF
ncbi:uncharacterized protein LOC126895930 [Daktulosphaira vitifoliae]|uniref:uncharacterized protein LOC126895930 n=1 Tax=Daktulosphaira vitifoliae TaxID=58002 RepID=UPI0021AA4906|nr:uncharacterized protein LOC126895930 [Daktulosphaira vitifoliae]